MTQTVDLQNILRYIFNSNLGNKYSGYRRIYRVFTNGLAPCMFTGNQPWIALGVCVPPNDGTTYSGTVQKDVESSVEHESATGQVVVKPSHLFGDLLVTGE